MIGSIIGKYRIVGQIGRGATGVVFKAVDATLSRDVAIKVLHAGTADAEIMRRFRAEATTLAQLSHPEIATIHELLQTETDVLMVMEFVRGETLERLSDRLGPMPPDRAASLIDRILAALEYAHRAGVVHRDMKPANVMVTELGGIKVMDFGTARVRGAEHRTMDGAVLGTPAYMAPEQVLGGDVDGRADLYSVGVVLYRLLTGVLPFEADTAIAMMQRQLSEPPVPLHERREDLPPWCEAIVERALAKSPADRFQTAGEFRETLARATGKAAADLLSPHPALDRAKSRSSHLARASIVMIVAAFLTVGGYVARRGSAALMSTTALPPVVFDAKVLVGGAAAAREREARLVLGDGMITVTATGDTGPPLHSVAYDGVASISYSRGRDPMWNSPDGPSRVVRAAAGVLGKWGIFVERNWISLRIDGDDEFVVLRVSDEQVENVLTALEKRTGLTADHIGAAN